jgi:peroxiredoxin
MLTAFGMVLPWFLLTFGAWVAWQLVRQNGRILLRLEAIELRGRSSGRADGPAPGGPQGLAIETVAPIFELPDLSGDRRGLSEFRGRNVLLLFFNPSCGFCTKLAPDLAALSAHVGNGWPELLVVTTGDAERNRALFTEHGIRCPVLLQKNMEIAAKYRAHGTPMGYLIDADGRIASELAIGAESLLNLATVPAVDRIGRSSKGGGSDKATGKRPGRSLAASRINRKGLKAGDVAPDFRLPQLDGQALELAELRGKRLLLVFSDPECGPCDELAPQLERIHRQSTDLQLLMVSRRDIETNRAKVARLGLTFPVVLQKSWEISLRYGMFATPIGYLIDERGTIVRDVAVGVAPILALVSESSFAIDAGTRLRRNGKEVAAAS